MMVDGRGVAEVLPEIRAHGLEHLGQNRRCGVIVEVNAMHTEPAFILRERRARDGRGGRRHMDTARGDIARRLLSLIDLDVVTGVFRAQVLRARPDQAVVVKLLDHVRSPTGNA